MKLIIGLGNPGKKYANTRHNVGFMAVQEIQNYFKLDDWKFEKKFNAEISKGTINEKKIIIAKPQTFMNNSGSSVKALQSFYKIEPKNILIIHDDIDIELGKTKQQKQRGAAGHNGVKSIIENLGTNKFERIRIGIRNEETLDRIPTEKYVLEKFTKEEFEKIKNSIKESIQKKNPF